MKRLMMLTGLTLAGAMCACSAKTEVDLEGGFREPPAYARPHTWWHWMNGNVTREGITADLEAMRQIGLGGAQIFNVSEGIPEGPVLYMSETWREMVQHAVREAGRLNLELCMHNCAGWSSSGGPWTKPEQAMQMVVTSERTVQGPSLFAETLIQPETRCDFYRDIAVLAFPTPADAGRRIPDFQIKAGYEARYGLQPQLDPYSPDAIVQASAIVDLTGRLRPDGRLEWSVPEGHWTILRFGYTLTGKENHPSPESGRGLECDKLSREAVDAHWEGMMGPVLRDIGPLAGKVLNNALIDSYEVGHQNWTARFREEFRQRRGYDLLPWLPTLTGRVIGNGEVSERFLWDYRRTIADLFADNYFGHFRELCRQNGLLTSIEPYDGPFECLLAGGPADIPMGEFWMGSREESNTCKLAASVGHIYGRRIIGAESFTAGPDQGRWQNHPYSMKAIGDLMYCAGINRFIVHRYAHQPWLDKFPGMTMGQWGTHFERTVTWWSQGREWVGYLTRCQYLLQQGKFAADVCYFAGEGAPNGAPHHPALKAAGYDYDACNADVLLHRMSVQDGRLVVQEGPSYRVLVLPDTPFMTPGLLTKLRDLVAQGATIVGPRPTRSPSLSDYPQCDATVEKLAEELWGDCDGAKITEHGFGRGRVIWGRTAEQVLAESRIAPDCQFHGAAGKPRMAWIHRVLGDADLYFVSNQKPIADEVEGNFRVVGKVPELWHPDTGEMELAPVWSEEDNCTTVPLHLDPAGSVFVLFRKPSQDVRHITAVKSLTPETSTASETLIKIIKAVYEAVDGTGGKDVTARVRELVEAGEFTIPADNQTFGDPTYMHVKRLRVDYTYRGQTKSKTVEENETLLLTEAAGPVAPPALILARSPDGRVEMSAFKPGPYEVQWSDGRTVQIAPKAAAEQLEISGPWTVRFPPDRGAPPWVTLDRLASLTAHEERGVRYFSGTMEYEKDIEIPASLLESGKVPYLDLGDVRCLAEVELNGQSLGVWWKPPFLAGVAGVARAGHNRLKVRVTNLWINRLIGDEQYPADCEWNGVVLKTWPSWLVEGRPRPMPERLTFTTWKHYSSDSPLVESGLLGPVRLRAVERFVLEQRP